VDYRIVGFYGWIVNRFGKRFWVLGFASIKNDDFWVNSIAFSRF